jgi:hypothetical protein
MTDDTAEASARLLTRAVPIVYGALFGALIDNLLLGTSLGILLSIALDSRMGAFSLFLPVLRPLLAGACPVVAVILRGLARLVQTIGLPAPSSWAKWPCGAPES